VHVLPRVHGEACGCGRAVGLSVADGFAAAATASCDKVQLRRVGCDVPADHGPGEAATVDAVGVLGKAAGSR
jgi:hypothetical protein